MVVRILRRGQSGLPTGEQGKQLLREHEQRRQRGEQRTGTSYFYEDLERKQAERQQQQQQAKITAATVKQPVPKAEPKPQPEPQRKGVGLSTAFATGGASVGTFIIDPYVRTNVYSDIKGRYLTREELKSQQVAKLPTIEKAAFIAGGLTTAPVIIGGIHPRTVDVRTVVQRTSPKTTESRSLITFGRKQAITKTTGIHTAPSKATVVRGSKIIPKGTVSSGFETKVIHGGKGTFIGGERSLVVAKKGAVKAVVSKGTVVKTTGLRTGFRAETKGITTSKFFVGKTKILGGTPKFQYAKGYSETQAILLKQGQSIPKVIPSGFKAAKAGTYAIPKAVTTAHSTQAGAVGIKLATTQTTKAALLTTPAAAFAYKPPRTTTAPQIQITQPRQETRTVQQVTTTTTQQETFTTTTPVETTAPPRTTTTPIQGQIPIQAPYQIPITTPRTAPPSAPPVSPPVTGVPRVPWFPILPWFPPLFSGKPPRPLKPLKLPFKTRYAPSLYGTESGVTIPKPPKIVAGLGFRPPVKKKRRKKRKR